MEREVVVEEAVAVEIEGHARGSDAAVIGGREPDVKPGTGGDGSGTFHLVAGWSGEHLQFAMALADALLEHFEDKAGGGFFFTANDHEELIHRPKPLADESVPSGNGIAAFALQRLGFLLGETRYLDAAERTLRAAWSAMQEYPHGHVTLLTALEEYLEHTEIIVIRGADEEIARWSTAAAKLYAPRRLVYAIPASEAGLPGALAERVPRDGESVAYRCLGTHCELPATSWEALATNLSGQV